MTKLQCRGVRKGACLGVRGSKERKWARLGKILKNEERKIAQIGDLVEHWSRDNKDDVPFRVSCPPAVHDGGEGDRQSGGNGIPLRYFGTYETNYRYKFCWKKWTSWFDKILKDVTDLYRCDYIHIIGNLWAKYLFCLFRFVVKIRSEQDQRPLFYNEMAYVYWTL